jgi:hypothetical protein
VEISDEMNQEPERLRAQSPFESYVRNYSREPFNLSNDAITIATIPRRIVSRASHRDVNEMPSERVRGLAPNFVCPCRHVHHRLRTVTSQQIAHLASRGRRQIGGGDGGHDVMPLDTPCQCTGRLQPRKEDEEH